MDGEKKASQSFDPNKRSDWFLVDLDGTMAVWLSLIAVEPIVVLALGFVVAVTTDFDPVGKLFGAMAAVNPGLLFTIYLGANALVAFWVVFVRRRNPNVVGKKRRQFRYIWTWL